MAESEIVGKNHRFTILHPVFVECNHRSFFERMAAIESIKRDILSKERHLSIRKKCVDCGYEACHAFYATYQVDIVDYTVYLCSPCRFMREVMGVAIESFDDYILDYIRTHKEEVDSISIVIHCSEFDFGTELEGWNPDELEPIVELYLKRLVSWKLLSHRRTGSGENVRNFYKII